MLARVDARKLRQDAGIRQLTVARALGVPPNTVYAWETGLYEPKCDAGRQWARFVCGLERHAEVAAELDEAA